MKTNESFVSINTNRDSNDDEHLLMEEKFLRILIDH